MVRAPPGLPRRSFGMFEKNGSVAEPRVDPRDRSQLTGPSDSIRRSGRPSITPRGAMPRDGSPELRIIPASRMTEERERLAELGEYATGLVNRLQSAHAADVRAAISDAERHTRLSQNLESARRLFGQRAGSQASQAAALWEDRLHAVLNSAPATAFSRSSSRKRRMRGFRGRSSP